MIKILITGGAGFIGSAVIRHIVNNTDHRVINVDKLTYAGNLESLTSIENNTRYIWAKQDEGAFKDGKNLPLKTSDQRNTYKIVASRSHMSDETQTFIDAIDTQKEKELISIGSSLKICLVAEGEADIYPRLGPTMEWDTGAAHAVVCESGKNLQKYKDGEYSKHGYNKENILNQWFVVQNGIKL
mgnify:CR=1 FL=1